MYIYYRLCSYFGNSYSLSKTQHTSLSLKNGVILLQGVPRFNDFVTHFKTNKKKTVSEKQYNFAPRILGRIQHFG